MKSIRAFRAHYCLARAILVVTSLSIMFLPACVAASPTVSFVVTPGSIKTDAFVQENYPAGVGYRSTILDIYFTDPASPFTFRKEDGIDQIIVETIDSAKVSVDIAIYNFDIYSIQKAVQDAANRGVSVRIVTESDNSENYSIVRLRDAGISVVEDDQNGLMHNKFVIIDGQQVWTGSANFSEDSFYIDDNVMILIKDAQIAQNYQVEFEELFSDGLFGAAGDTDQPYPKVTIGPYQIETLFSPDDAPVRPIVERIQKAENEIVFFTYALTGEDFGDALLEASANGVKIEGIFDDQLSNNVGSQLARLRSAGVSVWVDSPDRLMHQKVIVIDKAVVIVGSYNFSANAEKRNDENLLIIENPAIAQFFLDEFAKLKLFSEKLP